MPTVSTPRGLTYTPAHAAVTWSDLHGDLVALGELLSVTVRCGLATGCCYVQTADRALGRSYQHKLEPNGRTWYLGRAELLATS